MGYFCESLDIMDALENDPVRQARKERKRKKMEETRAQGGWKKLAHLKRKEKRGLQNVHKVDHTIYTSNAHIM